MRFLITIAKKVRRLGAIAWSSLLPSRWNFFSYALARKGHGNALIKQMQLNQFIT